MATNPFAVPGKKKVGYKNPFGVNVQNGQSSTEGIYNPQEVQDVGWGQNAQVDIVENFPQFNNNNNVTQSNSFANFNQQPNQSNVFNAPQQNKAKVQQPKPAVSSNPFAFNQNVQFGGETQNDNNTNIDMNFSMDDGNNNYNNSSNNINQQKAVQPKRFDPNQLQFQQQISTHEQSQQQYSSGYENLGFDPNNVDPDNEPPLLVELGIDLNSIKVRTLSVLKFQKCDIKFLEDPDMSGPIILGFLFGFFLLLSGKLHFGYVYGFGISGTIAIYCIMNFLSMNKEIPLYNTLSILGYCLMPVIILSFINVFMSLNISRKLFKLISSSLFRLIKQIKDQVSLQMLKFIAIKLMGFSGGIFSLLSVIWSTYSATNFFNELIHQEHQKYLVAYPIFLFYSTFVILTIF